MDFQTPDWCCKYMVSLMPEMGSYDVLEPTPGEGNLVKELNKKHLVTAPDDFWKLDIDSRFEYVVMNPPFTPMDMGYKILYRCMEMSDNIIALMPWLTLINSEKRTKDIKIFGLKSVTHLPRKTFAGSRVQCCILEMIKGYSDNTELKWGYDLCET